MDKTLIATKDNIEIGKIYWFYNNYNYNAVCKGRVIAIMQHPRFENEKLILYEWFFKGQSYSEWKYDTIDTEILEEYYEHVKDKLKKFNDKMLKQDNIKW